MSKKGRCRVSYLLRLWQAEREGTLIWRASLESAHTGERWGFATLEELFAFLREQLGLQPNAGGAGPSEGVTQNRVIGHGS